MQGARGFVTFDFAREQEVEVWGAIRGLYGASPLGDTYLCGGELKVAEALDIRGLLDFVDTPGLGYYEFDNLHTISAPPPMRTVEAPVTQPISAAANSDNSTAAAAAAAAAAASASASVAAAAMERETVAVVANPPSDVAPPPSVPIGAREAPPNPAFAALTSCSTSTPTAAFTLTPSANAGAIYGSMDLRSYGSVAEAVRVNVNQGEASAVASVNDAAAAADSVAAKSRTLGERVVVGGAEKVEAAADALDGAAEELKDAGVETQSAAAEPASARTAIAAPASSSAGTFSASKPLEASAKTQTVSKSDDTGPEDGSGSLAELFRKL